jgi:hypothetical protein
MSATYWIRGLVKEGDQWREVRGYNEVPERQLVIDEKADALWARMEIERRLNPDRPYVPIRIDRIS